MRCVPNSVIDYYNNSYKFLYHLSVDTLVYVINDNEEVYFTVDNKDSDEVVLQSLEGYQRITVGSKAEIEFINGCFVLNLI